MAVGFTYQVKINLTGDQIQSQVFEKPVASTNSNGAIGQYQLNPGDNTMFSGNFSFQDLSISAFLVVPPATNTTAIVLKGETTDVGIQISPNSPTLLAVDTSATTQKIILNAATTIQNVTFARL